jgi:hypothetical protein
MSTNRRRGLHADLRGTHPEKRPTNDKYPGRRFPIQNEIRKLEEELSAFNDRIAELEDEGHRGHALQVSKAKALDFARQIDELRSLLVAPIKKDEQRRTAEIKFKEAMPTTPGPDTSANRHQKTSAK